MRMFFNIFIILVVINFIYCKSYLSKKDCWNNKYYKEECKNNNCKDYNSFKKIELEECIYNCIWEVCMG